MDKESGNLKRLNACSELLNYRTKKTPCTVCTELKDMIDKQNQQIAEMITDQKLLKDKFAKLQATTEQQNKVIVEMLAEHKIELQMLVKSRHGVTALKDAFPLKTEENLKKLESEIDESNEENYILAATNLIGGNAIKNLELILSRELCMMYNTDGICGKKSFKNYKKVYNIVIAAIGNYSSNAEKEFRTALQVVKKRHFRLMSMRKKQDKNSN